MDIESLVRCTLGNVNKGIMYWNIWYFLLEFCTGQFSPIQWEEIGTV